MRTPAFTNTMQSFFFIAILVVSFTACKNDTDDIFPAETFKTITQVLEADTSYSILNAAIAKTGLANTLNDDSKSYSLFAPKNSAFRAGNMDATVINNLTPLQVDTFLRPALLYHVADKKFLLASFPTSDTIKTANGKYLFSSNNVNGVFLNGAKIIGDEIYVANGVIHPINGVLIPPSKTIIDIVNGNANFSLLKTAIQKAGLTTRLSQAGKYAVFAPINAGFPVSLDNSTKINAADSVVVLGIVGSHFFTTNIFASDLVAGATTATYNPAKTLTFSLSPTATVKITGSANAATAITTTNILATNGVVHVINNLLQ
jgi:uncharacterized surface protein with fasciclin (FAS1) repeats